MLEKRVLGHEGPQLSQKSAYCWQTGTFRLEKSFCKHILLGRFLEDACPLPEEYPFFGKARTIPRPGKVERVLRGRNKGSAR